jgi:hypothetical protein
MPEKSKKLPAERFCETFFQSKTALGLKIFFEWTENAGGA